MPVREFLIRNFDSTNPDTDLDRIGCRKRGMCDGYFDQGGTTWNEPGSEIKLPKFCVIACDLTDAEIAAYEGLRKVWRDDFGYEVIDERPAKGEYDIRVFEQNPGAINQNAIAGVKATRIRDYLLSWGCSNFTLTETGGSFTFSLSDAVKSSNFWNVPVLVLAELVFSIDSYNPATGGGTITVTFPDEPDPIAVLRKTQFAIRKIEERGGVIVSANYPNFTFTITRGVLVEKFKSDVKRRVQKIYMYQQYKIRASVMDQIEAVGGYATLTKSQLVAAIQDMAAE